MEMKSVTQKAESVREVLTNTAQRLSPCEVLRDGVIAFRLTGEGGGDCFLDCRNKIATLIEGQPPRDEVPLLEVIGDGERISSIVAGKKNAQALFLAGGIRVRGDIEYLSKLAVEARILNVPILAAKRYPNTRGRSG